MISRSVCRRGGVSRWWCSIALATGLIFLAYAALGTAQGTQCPDLENWTGDVVSWENALRYVGRDVVIEADVAQTRYSTSTGITSLDLGNAYPSPYRVSIEIPRPCEGAFVSRFGARPVDYFQGKTIRVYGRVQRPDDVAPALLRMCDPHCVEIVPAWFIPGTVVMPPSLPVTGTPSPPTAVMPPSTLAPPVSPTCPDLENWTGDVVSWENALRYVGRDVVIEADVAQTRYSTSTGITSLDLGNAYPSPYRVSIEIPRPCEGAFVSRFGARPVDYFQGKTIRVYGRVQRPDDVAPALLRMCDPHCVEIVPAWFIPGTVVMPPSLPVTGTPSPPTAVMPPSTLAPPVSPTCPDLENWTGDVVSWENALRYVGRDVVVEADVAQTRYSTSTGITSLDLGNAYPSPYRVSIEIPRPCEGAFVSRFGARPVDYFQGKTIRVYGRVQRPDDVAPALLRMCDPHCVEIVPAWFIPGTVVMPPSLPVTGTPSPPTAVMPPSTLAPPVSPTCPDLENWTGPLVSWQDAGSYVGESVVVHGPVAASAVMASEGMIYLSLGNPYPNVNRVTVGIPIDCDGNFILVNGASAVDYFQGKVIRVYGQLQGLDDGAPGILGVCSPDCVKIVGSTAVFTPTPPQVACPDLENWAGSVVPWEEANDHLGGLVVVEGPVVASTWGASEGMIYLSLGNPYPNVNRVTIGIPIQCDGGFFLQYGESAVDCFDGKTIQVYGRLQGMDDGAPGILNVCSPDCVKVVFSSGVWVPETPIPITACPDLENWTGPVVPWEAANSYVGQSVVVEGPVVASAWGESAGMIYLSLGNPYPNVNRVTVGIPIQCDGNFVARFGQSAADYFQGKTIRVYGRLQGMDDGAPGILEVCSPDCFHMISIVPPTPPPSPVGQPDLAVTAIELVPSVPKVCLDVMIEVVVENLGTKSVDGVPVQFQWLDNSGMSQQTGEAKTGLLPAGASTTVRYTAAAPDFPGRYMVIADVDPGDSVQESNEANNGASVNVDVEVACVDQPPLGWASGPEGILLRWRWPKSDPVDVCDLGLGARPSFFVVYRDDQPIANVKRIVNEGESKAVLGQQLWTWLRDSYTDESLSIESIGDLHVFFNENPLAEMWVSDQHYPVALVRGMGFLDVTAVLGKTYSYRVVAWLESGDLHEVGSVEITHQGFTPFDAPENLKEVAFIDPSKRSSADWVVAQQNRKAHRRIYLIWDLPTEKNVCEVPETWITSYDVFRAIALNGPYERLTAQGTEVLPVVATPSYEPSLTEEQEKLLQQASAGVTDTPDGVSPYEEHSFFFVDADPDLQCCHIYFYRVAPRDLLGQPRDWNDPQQHSHFSAYLQATPQDLMPPAAPTSLSAVTDHVGGRVLLSWGPGDNADLRDDLLGVTYHVYRSTTPEAAWPDPTPGSAVYCSSQPCWTEMTTTDGIQNTWWADTAFSLPADQDQPFWYVVRAKDAPCGIIDGNFSAPSQAVSAILHDRVPPGKPTVYRRELPGLAGSSYEILFLVGDNDVARYLVFLSVEGGPFVLVAELEGFQGDKNLGQILEQIYQPPRPVRATYLICAVDANGNRSDDCTEGEVLLGVQGAQKVEPPEPRITKARIAGTPGAWEVHLHWIADLSPGHIGFCVERKRLHPEVEQDWTVVSGPREECEKASLPREVRVFVDRGVEADAIYEYRVVAWRERGFYGPDDSGCNPAASAPYAVRVVDPLQRCERPLFPIEWEQVTFVPGQGTTLRWQNPAPAANEAMLCVVYRSHRADGDYVQLTAPFIMGQKIPGIVKEEIGEYKYVDSDATHSQYWYILVELDHLTGEVIASAPAIRPESTAAPAALVGETPLPLPSPMPTSAPVQQWSPPATADTFVSEGDPNGNHGTEEQWIVGVDPEQGEQWSGLLRFDLSDVPAASTIQSALLKAYVVQTSLSPSDEGAKISVSPCQSPWSESSATWDNRPTAGTRVAVARAGEITGDWTSWDVTGLVREWVSGAPDEGVTLEVTRGSSPVKIGFASRESGPNAPVLEIQYIPPPPSLHFEDGFILRHVSYIEGSTLQDLSGSGMLLNLGQIEKIEVPFSHLVVATDGRVIQGEADVPIASPIAIRYPNGFTYILRELKLGKGTSEDDQIGLRLPAGIVALRSGMPETPLVLQANVHADLTLDSTLDPGQQIGFELDPLPLRVVPTSSITVTEKSMVFSQAITKYVARYYAPGASFPDLPGWGNDGYLSVPYVLQAEAVIDPNGLFAEFSTTAPIQYTTTLPYDFEITASGGADLHIEASRIVGGELRKGTVSLFYLQSVTWDPADPSARGRPVNYADYKDLYRKQLTEPLAFEMARFEGQFKSLTIGEGGSLLGAVQIGLAQILPNLEPNPVPWGNGSYKLREMLYELYVPRVITAGTPSEEARASCLTSSKIQSGLNRVTEADESVAFEYWNCSGWPPITFPKGVSADVYLRKGGVSGLLKAQIEVGTPVAAKVFGYTMDFTNFHLSFSDNRLCDSDVSADVHLPYPANFTLHLDPVWIDDKGCIEGAGIRDDETEKGVVAKFWMANLYPSEVSFREPGWTSIDADWRRALWIIGDVEIPHLRFEGKSGKADLKLTFRPDGVFDHFEPLYEAVSCTFDGFDFLLESIRLSDYCIEYTRDIPSKALPPGTERWNVDPAANIYIPMEKNIVKGFFEIGGVLTVPYLGAIGGASGTKPMLQVWATHNYVGFTEQPCVERTWNLVKESNPRSFSFDLVYAHHHSEHAGMFVGFRVDDLEILTMDQAVVISSADGKVRTDILLGQSSGTGLLRALAETTHEELPEELTNSSLDKTMTDEWLPSFSDLDKKYVNYLAWLWEKYAEETEEDTKKDYRDTTKLIDSVGGETGADDHKIPMDPTGGGTKGELSDWDVELNKMRGDVEFTMDGSQFEKMQLSVWFDAGEEGKALVHANRLSFSITRDNDYIMSAEGAKSSIFELMDLEIDFDVIVNPDEPVTVEAGLLVYQLKFEVLTFDKVGAVFGVGDGRFYVGGLADASFDLGTLGGAFLFGSIDSNSLVLRNNGFADLLDTLSVTGEKKTLEGGYVRVYGDFPIYNAGCWFRVNVGGEVAGWYFAEKSGVVAYGGRIRGYIYGKALCIISARGDLTLEISRPGKGSDPFKIKGKLWVAGGIGFCSPGSWRSWESRWWGDSWCWTAGALIEANYNWDDPNAWVWYFDDDYE